MSRESQNTKYGNPRKRVAINDLWYDFDSSYVGQLRRLVGKRLLLVPGARIIVRDAEGCSLLQKRSDFGAWGLPGGNAEEGENLETVIVREVKEETGLEVHDVQPFGFGSTPSLETFTFPNGDRAQHFVMNFFTHRYDGEPEILDDESTGLALVPAREPTRNAAQHARERRSLRAPPDLWPVPIVLTGAEKRFTGSGQ